MINSQLFLMKNRMRKKWIIYKRFSRLIFDFTSLFYMLLVAGYFIVAIVLEGNIMQTVQEVSIQVEAFTVESFWTIMTVIPFIYLIRGFQQPGVIFSTAEYLLTILPNRRLKVWFVAALFRWLKAFVFFLFGGLVLFMLSPTSGSLIVLYVAILLFMNMIMTVVEWNFFQMHVWKKLAVILVLIIINVISFYVPSSIIGISVISLLIVYNVTSIPTLFTKVDWKKVTAASDFQLWNMKIIQQATKIKYRKERQYSIWQRLPFWKRPFPYKKRVAYNRLWHLYIEKNSTVFLQMIGALLLLLIVLVFIKKSLFLFAIALTIHIYTSLAVSMFYDRLVTDIVEVLPWDLHTLKTVLSKWLMYISVIFLLPYFLYVYLNFSYWVIPQIIVIIFTFHFILRIKLDKVIATFDRTFKIKSWLEIVSFGLLIIITFSSLFPQILMIGCFIVIIIPIVMKLTKV